MGIDNVRNYATRWIEKRCQFDNAFKYSIECLDNYDVSEFLSEGRCIRSIIDAIEEKYDKEFKEKYGIYMFDILDGEDICQYLASRYNVRFQEYRDWVVRHEDGVNEKARRRT